MGCGKDCEKVTRAGSDSAPQRAFVSRNMSLPVFVFRQRPLLRSTHTHPVACRCSRRAGTPPSLFPHPTRSRATLIVVYTGWAVHEQVGAADQDVLCTGLRLPAAVSATRRACGSKRYKSHRNGTVLGRMASSGLPSRPAISSQRRSTTTTYCRPVNSSLHPGHHHCLWGIRCRRSRRGLARDDVDTMIHPQYRG